MRHIKEDYTDVAKEIYRQLGKKALYMMGMKHVSSSDEKMGALNIRFTGSKKCNHVKIVLNFQDTYDITFYKIRGMDYKIIAEYEDIYVDQLHDIIESETGLYLSL